MNYIIEKLNGKIEIENPTIEVVGLILGNPDISNINFVTKKYSIVVELITNDAKFEFVLNDVQALSLDWTDGQNIPEQVLTALNEQFGV
mgnify:CR=1 FL=1